MTDDWDNIYYEERRATEVQRVSTSMILFGFTAVILGAVILVWPAPSIVVVAVLFGVYLVVSAVDQVVFAFSLHVSAGERVLLFISGAAALILAVLAFRHFGKDPLTAILLLAIWIGVGFLFRGVATTVSASAIPPCRAGRGRYSWVSSACWPAS